MVGSVSLIPKTSEKLYSRPKAIPAQARFGFGADTLSRILEPITEQFIWNFSVQDFCDLIVPRSIIGLIRGRKTDVKPLDPSITDKNPLQQLTHSTKQYLSSLNYSNATEEAIREVGTGLSLLISQALFFGGASGLLLGKLALMMRYSHLKSFKEAFIQSVKNHTIHDGMREWNSRFFEREIQSRFLKDMLVKGHFKDGLNTTIPSLNASKDEVLKAFIQKTVFSPEKATYGQTLNSWIDQWVRLDKKSGKQALLKKTKELEEVFERLVLRFNDNVKRIIAPEKIITLDIPLLGKKESGIKADVFVENLRKFNSFTKDAHRMARRLTSTSATKGWGKQVQAILIGATEKIYRRVVVIKPVLSIIAPILAGFAAISVAKISQGGKSYPANRNLHAGNNSVNREGAK